MLESRSGAPPSALQSRARSTACLGMRRGRAHPRRRATTASAIRASVSGSPSAGTSAMLSHSCRASDSLSLRGEEVSVDQGERDLGRAAPRPRKPPGALRGAVQPVVLADLAPLLGRAYEHHGRPLAGSLASILRSAPLPASCGGTVSSRRARPCTRAPTKSAAQPEAPPSPSTSFTASATSSAAAVGTAYRCSAALAAATSSLAPNRSLSRSQPRGSLECTLCRSPGSSPPLAHPPPPARQPPRHHDPELRERPMPDVARRTLLIREGRGERSVRSSSLCRCRPPIDRRPNERMPKPDPARPR